MNCPSCGTELPDAAKFCGSCAFDLSARSPGAADAGSSALSSLSHMRSYEEIAQTPSEVGVGQVLGEAWEITKPNLGLLIGGTLVVGVIMMAAGAVPFGSFIIGGPLMGGAIAVALRLVAGRPVEFSNFFDGFKRFVPLMLVNLVMSVLVMVGSLALVLPGIYLALAFMFGTTLVVDRDEEFWPALMGSMKVVNGHIGLVLMYCLAMFGLALAGALTCGLGFLVVGPLMMVASAVLYKHLFGIAGGAERLG